MVAVAVVVSLPQLAVLVGWDAWARHWAAATALTGLLERVVTESGAEAACSADAEAWASGLIPAPRPGGPGPLGTRWRGPRPPPAGARRPLRAGLPPGPPPMPPMVPPWITVHENAPAGVDAELPAGTVERVASGLLSPEVAVVMRTGWRGPCAFVVVHGSTAPGFLGSALPASPAWVVPAVLVATVMFLAVGPTVRRIHRLTEAVRAGSPRVALEGDDELAELSRAFDAARAALDAEIAARRSSEGALRDFVANTVHDVRVPLTVLRGHLASLEQDHSDEVLQRATEEAHYLGALLDNLAAHARMEEATQRFRIDLGGVIERVVARHRPLARRASVTLVHGLPGESVWIEADPTLAEQALSNLVYNAVRHNRVGGHVAVTLDVEPGAFRIAVTDDGPGVDPQELERLTERGYTSVDARGRDGAGQGLGLHIVARVVEDHGWAFALSPSAEGGLEALITGSVAS